VIYLIKLEVCVTTFFQIIGIYAQSVHDGSELDG